MGQGKEILGQVCLPSLLIILYFYPLTWSIFSPLHLPQWDAFCPLLSLFLYSSETALWTGSEKKFDIRKKTFSGLSIVVEVEWSLAFPWGKRAELGDSQWQKGNSCFCYTQD